jgi:hypothetical protein
MTQNFTQNALIRFLYDEVSSAEKIAILEALEQDRELRKEYQTLKEAYRKLPRAKFNAPKSSIQKIMEYNQRTALEKC